MWLLIIRIKKIFIKNVPGLGALTNCHAIHYILEILMIKSSES